MEDEECREDWREWVIVRTTKDAIAILSTGIVTEVSLDHDLGREDVYGTGYDVLIWIERQVHTNKSFECPTIHIHTANPSAAKKMRQGVESIKKVIKPDGV